MAISDLLTQLNDVKQAIKQAISNKGVSMSNVPFTKYASKIDSITTGPTNTQNLSTGFNVGASSTQTLYFTFTNLTKVVGVTSYNLSTNNRGSGATFSINGNTVTATVSNGSGSQSIGGSLSITAIGY